jgi:polyisoprenoid-binding protein YceI
MQTRLIQTAILACLVALLAPAAFADTWNIDPAHTTVEFSVRHMTISNVKGVFNKVSGQVTANGEDPKQIQIEATIDASTLDTRQPKRDEDLKGPNFFDVAKYPTITFKSKRIETAGAGKWQLIGDLTLHGVTREVTLNVEGPSTQVKDPHGNIHIGAHATTTINRQDFGLTWNRTMDTGGVMIGNEVSITIDVEVVKKAA